MSNPTRRDWHRLRRLVQYLKGAKRVVYQYRWQAGDLPIRVFTDTDFAGCHYTRRSTSGGCILIGTHLIRHWSTTQKVVTLSSGEAELAGIVKGAAEGIGIRSLCEDLGRTRRLEIHADSSAAVGICSRSGIGRVRHLAVAQLWVQERIKTGDISLYKVAGAANPGDMLTKGVARDLLDQHMTAVSLMRSEGRAESAPEISAFFRGRA